MKKIVVLFTVVLIASGCHCTQDAGRTNRTDRGNLSLDGDWELEYLSGDKPFSVLFPNILPYLRVNKSDYTLSGQDGCNQYTAKFTANDSHFKVDVGTLISTKMFCEGGGGQAFSDALSRVDSYVVENGKLELKSGNVVVLRFHKK